MPKYMQIATVSGNGNFPLDMLRYCHAWPHSSSDAIDIGASFDSSPMRNNDPRIRSTIAVAMHTPNKQRAWVYEARWNSFGWKVEGVEVIQL